MRPREKASFWRRRHFSMSFYSEIVVVGIKRYQMLDCFYHFALERALNLLQLKKNRALFTGKKVELSFAGSRFFENTQKNLKLNLVLVVFLVLESKQIYYFNISIIRIRATVNILRLHFFQTLCCFRRKSSRIMRPPSCTIHQTSTLPSKRSVLL